MSAEIWKPRRGGQALSIPGLTARPAQLKTKNKLPFWTVVSSVFNELFSDEMFTSRKYTSTSCSVAFEWTTLWRRPTKRKKLGSNMSYSGFHEVHKCFICFQTTRNGKYFQVLNNLKRFLSRWLQSTCALLFTVQNGAKTNNYSWRYSNSKFFDY